MLSKYIKNAIVKIKNIVYEITGWFLINNKTRTENITLTLNINDELITVGLLFYNPKPSK